MASVPVHGLTEEQYLALERKAEFKSEFYAGEMFAMAGGSIVHGILQMDAGTEINSRLVGRDGGAFTSDVKIKVVATGLYTYPDLSVVCGRPVTTDEHKDTITNPIVIVEVVSPSTEAYDRGKKFQQYQTIPTLQEYILVSQAEPLLERFTRSEDNTWTLRTYSGKDAVLRIDAIDISIPLQSIYRRVEFE